MYDAQYLPEDFEQWGLQQVILWHLLYDLNMRSSQFALIQECSKKHLEDSLLREEEPILTAAILLSLWRGFEGACNSSAPEVLVVSSQYYCLTI